MTTQPSRIRKILSRIGFLAASTADVAGGSEAAPVLATGDSVRNDNAQFTTVTTEANLNDGMTEARFYIGQVVCHKMFPFRGVVFDVDPTFSNTDDWYEAIPEEVRPRKDQPYYHLLAENDKTHYIAYVSEQNLKVDDSCAAVNHPEIEEIFGRNDEGGYEIHPSLKN